MGNLAHLVNQSGDDSLALIAQMQAKLKRADNTLETMAGMLEERLSEANEELSEALSSVVDEKVVKIVSKAIEANNSNTAMVLSGLKALARDIKNIPAYPPPQDVVPHLARLEKKLINRTHTFEVDRDPIDGLIQSIKVRTE